MKVYKNLFEQIINPENLFISWERFKKGKRNKPDVAQFEFELEQNIFQLHRDLRNKKYKHGSYTSFYIQDPKRRHIHKAVVRDRVLHHAIFRILNMTFEPIFIPTSFSCRVGKGNHKGVLALEDMVRKVSKNNSKPCFVLKCDIKKFFDTIDHKILLNLLGKKIKDNNTMWLLEEIVESYSSKYSNLFERKGVPIGNLTSQLFANVFMNEFDQFVKHKLKIKDYIRYTDDFVIVADNELFLKNLIPPIQLFLMKKLALKLHPRKVIIRKFHQGIDFLGYIVFPHHRLVRTKTRQRIFLKIRNQINNYKNGTIKKESLEQSLNSYLGVLSHADTYQLSKELKNQFWFWITE
jgi:retron-type reverse transcriptase